MGADGVRSSVRGFLFRDEKDAPFYTGHTAWRALLPAEAVAASLRAKEVNLWLGRGAHVVHYPLRGGEIVNALVVIGDGDVEPPPSEPIRDGASLLESAGFEDCAGPLRELIAACDSWRRWPLWGRPALRSLDARRRDAARRRGASDAALPGAGRGAGDRGRGGFGERLRGRRVAVAGLRPL